MEQRDNLNIFANDAEVDAIVAFKDFSVVRHIEFGDSTAGERQKRGEFYTIAYSLTPAQGGVFTRKFR